MFIKFPNKERVKKALSIRSSNAATPVPNKKKYSRKTRKQWKKEINNDN